MRNVIIVPLKLFEVYNQYFKEFKASLILFLNVSDAYSNSDNAMGMAIKRDVQKN